MNPQQDLFYGGGYPMGNANRSPSLSRPGYGTLSSLPPPSRGGQRQVESGGQNLPSLYGEDRFNSYDAAFRTTRLHPSQGFPEPFMLNNNQGWGGFHPGAATVNGAMGGDGNRLRPSNRRGQIPSVSYSLGLCISSRDWR